MIVHRLEGQGFINVFALGLVVREIVVGAAPFLSKGVPVDFGAFDADLNSDGGGRWV